MRAPRALVAAAAVALLLSAGSLTRTQLPTPAPSTVATEWAHAYPLPTGRAVQRASAAQLRPGRLDGAFECVTTLAAACVSRARGLSTSSNTTTVGVCPIDRLAPIPLPVASEPREAGTSWGPPAFAAVLHRPHHALHFFLAVASAYAAVQETIGVSPDGAPAGAVYVALFRYGGVASWDLSRHPHLGLIPLVFGDGVHAFVPASVAPHIVVPPRQLVPTKVCHERLTVGSLPQRIPGRYANLPPSMLAPKHYAALRQRIARRIGHDDDALSSRYVLLVERRTPGRLLLNALDVATVVRDRTRVAVRTVSWEGMPLAAQLRLAAGAAGMIGVHGNGFAWACVMRPGAFVVELASSIVEHNEVREGRGVMTAGNVAPACGLPSLSLLCPWEESNSSAAAPQHRRWKEVNIVASQGVLRRMAKFIDDVFPRD